MKFCLYTNSISAHQLPLSREIAAIVGANNFSYVYGGDFNNGAAQEVVANDPWITKEVSCAETSQCLLVGGMRPFKMVANRLQVGLSTLYMSERWFKPPIGLFRLFHPAYIRMALKFVDLLRRYDKLLYLPIGIHAAGDMARLCGLFSGDLKCLFRAPELNFERKPGGRIWLTNGGDGKRYCLDKMRMWGYFVAPSQYPTPNDSTPNTPSPNSSTQKVLWAGRLLKLKRVDTIIRAIGELSKRSTCSTRFTLDIYGSGPEEKHLKKMAAKYGGVIKFYPPVPISDVRKLMREHDVYVFSSNGYEGWGAVVSEALEEGMRVIGTYEAGGSATMLPKECLFRCGDWRGIAQTLVADIKPRSIGAWTASSAARWLVSSLGFS